jgi:hypothetical protein
MVILELRKAGRWRDAVRDCSNQMAITLKTPYHGVKSVTPSVPLLFPRTTSAALVSGTVRTRLERLLSTSLLRQESQPS